MLATFFVEVFSTVAKKGNIPRCARGFPRFEYRVPISAYRVAHTEKGGDVGVVGQQLLRSVLRKYCSSYLSRRRKRAKLHEANTKLGEAIARPQTMVAEKGALRTRISAF